MSRERFVSGFVVKVQWFDEDPTTHVRHNHRREVSRTFHSRDAAQTCMALLKKQNPDRDYFIHEKTKREDDAPIR